MPKSAPTHQNIATVMPPGAPLVKVGRWRSRALLFAFGMLLVMPVQRSLSAQAVVLNFDSIAQVNVTAQYANRGVVLNSPLVRDFSAMSGFARSGTRAIELCFAIEFCTTPLRVDFTAGQARAKVWVGYSSPLPEARTVVLQALDENDALVTQMTAALPPNSSAIQVQTPLEVTSTSSNIRRLVLMFAGSGSGPGYNNGLVVDDVEFDTVGAPPACSVTDPPIVTLFSPPQVAPVVNINQFILQGLVSTDGPLTEASVEIYSGSNVKTFNVLGGIISPNGGPFGPTNLSGALVEGGNAVFIIARNCRGVASQAGVVTFTPPSSQSRFRMLGLEVVQATQDLQNSVPLVSNKATMVRVYLGLNGATSPIANLTGAITATRAGGAFVPPILASSNSITVAPTQTVQSARASLGASLNFVLPAEWITDGTLHFELSKIYIQGIESNIPCDGCANQDAIGAPNWAHFNPVRPINIVLAPYVYSNGLTPDVLFTPMGAFQWMNNVYPLPGNFPGDPRGIRIVRILPMRATGRDLRAGSDDGSSFISAMEIERWFLLLLNQNVWPNDFHLFAITPCGCGGLARRNGSVGYGDVWNQEAGSVVPQASFETYGQYWAHEIGHNLGRKHASNSHGESQFDSYFSNSVDASFTLPHGGVGQPGVAMNTFQWKGMPYLINPGVAAAGQAHAHELMSYGHVSPERTVAWITPYTYKGLFQKLVQVAQAQAPAPQTPIELIVVGGRINADSTATLERFRRITARYRPDSHTIGNVVLNMVDSAGRILASHRFETTTTDGTRSVSFSGVVPWQPGTREMVLIGRSGVLAKRLVSANSPRVRITGPTGREKWDKNGVVTWQAEDADGDSLTFSVYYRQAASEAWLPVATEISGNRIEIDTRLLPGTTRAQFRVEATDGVNTTAEESTIEISVNDKAPLVGIHRPKNGDTFVAGSKIELAGLAYDPEEGTLAERSLVWSSDRDGILGYGTHQSVSKLSPGAHVISLAGTDSKGHRSVHTAKVRVGAGSGKN